MSTSEVAPYTDLVLPVSVVTKADLSRLLTEAERIDNDLTTAAVRAKAGSNESTTPTPSESLAQFLEQNNVGLDDTNVRSQLVRQLRTLKDKVPIVHVTFAATADEESLQRIVAWFRESVHPQTVIAAGVQPGLIAGVYMRTPNHVHDFSLRARLKGQRELLRKELEATRGNQ